MKYTIERRPPEQLPNGRRKGVYVILDENGEEVRRFHYTLNNYADRRLTRIEAETYIKNLIRAAKSKNATE